MSWRSLLIAAVVFVALLNDEDRTFVEARSRLAMGTSGGFMSKGRSSSRAWDSKSSSGSNYFEKEGLDSEDKWSKKKKVQRQKNLLADDSCVGLCYFHRKRESERARSGLPPADDIIARKFREMDEKKKEFRQQIKENEEAVMLAFEEAIESGENVTVTFLFL